MFYQYYDNLSNYFCLFVILIYFFIVADSGINVLTFGEKHSTQLNGA